MFWNRNAYMSAASSIRFEVGLPAPWPAFDSMRIRIGASPAWACRSAAAILKAANAPKINGDYVAIIHPYVAYDLMMAAGDAWMDVHKYASPENIYNGEIGKLGGVRFVETTEAKIVSNGETSPINIFCTTLFAIHISLLCQSDI